MFTRTSADILEDLYEDFLGGIGDEGIHEELKDMELDTLNEQQDVELDAKEDMRNLRDDLVVLDGLKPDEGHLEVHEIPDHVSLKSVLESTYRGSDLYQAALRWSSRTVLWVRSIYPNDAEHARDLYRVAINAAVVPAKIQFAEEEEQNGDQLGLEFARIEYKLAVAYMGLSVDSLKRLQIHLDSAEMAYRHSQLILKELEAAERRLASRLSFRSPTL